MMLAKSSAAAVRTAVGGATELHKARRALLSFQSTGVITHRHQTSVKFSTSTLQQERRSVTAAIPGAAATRDSNTRSTLVGGGDIVDVSPSSTSVPRSRSSTAALVDDEAFPSVGRNGIKTKTAAQNAAQLNVTMNNNGILSERASWPSLSSGLGLERGDLRLGDFMEEVKNELWQYNAMPFRRRFRVQSLLRRLQTPPFESWMNSLKRATDCSSRPFTRTLLARHEGSTSLPSSLAPGFDLLLLCWKPGAISPIHDHPRAGCWVKVLSGQINETRYSVASTEDNGISIGNNGTTHGSRLIETSDATYGAGTVTYIEDSMGYHKMSNASSTEECISLHLYAPGIKECTTWADVSSMSPRRSAMVLDDSFVLP